jgi:Myb-like DNA-binding domain
VRSAKSKSIKRGKKRKSLASLAEVNAKLDKEEPRHTEEHASVPKNNKNLSKFARGADRLGTSQGKLEIQLEPSRLAKGTKGDNLTVESKENASESPRTNAGQETSLGDKSYPLGTPQELRKRGARSRKSAAVKLSGDDEVLEGQELSSNSRELEKVQHAIPRVNRSGPLHLSGAKEVENVNLKPTSNLKKPLNLLNFNNGIGTKPTALHLAENRPTVQIPILDTGRSVESPITSEDMFSSSQLVSGAKIGAHQDTPITEQAQQDTPISKSREQKSSNLHKLVDTPKKKKRKRDSEKSDVTTLGERFLEDPPPLGSDLPAMKRTVSPPFRVVIPAPLDSAISDPSVSVRSGSSKKRKKEVQGVSSIAINRYSVQSYFLPKNPSPARMLQGSPTSLMQGNPSSLINADHESELEFHTTQNDYYNHAETQRAKRKMKRQLKLSNKDTGEKPSSSISKKSSRSALKPKPPRDSKDQQFNQNFVKGRSTAASSRKKLSATKPTVTGKFSGDEIAIIDNEMLKHREMHDMTTFYQNQLVQDNARGASELYDEICKSLPGRTRSSIVKICRRRYHNFEARGKWTEDDDEALRAAYTQHPNGWKEISKAINRHPEDVRDRWRNYLICGDNLKKARWTDKEEENLRAVVEECLENIRRIRKEATMQLGSQPDMRPDIDLVDWQTVSSKLGRTRSRLQCISKWKQLQEREDPYNEKNKEAEIRDNTWRAESAKKLYRSMERVDKYDLLLAIKNSRAGTEGKVPWNKLGDAEFQQKWPCMVRKLAWKRLRAKVTGNEDMRFQDIVYKLIDSFREVLVDDLSDIDTITPTRRYRRGPRKPPLSEKFVHSDTDEEPFERRNDQKAGRRRKRKRGMGETANGDAKRHSHEGIKRDLSTNKQKRKIRDRMARAEEILGQPRVGLNGEEADNGEDDIEHEDEDDGRERTRHEEGSDREGIGYFGPLIDKPSLTQDMVHNAVNEAYEEYKPTNHGDDDRSDEKDEDESDEELTSNSQYHDRQSIDLGEASHHGGTLSQLDSRSPKALSNDETQDNDDYDDDDDDDGENGDIPARRPVLPRRLQSVEL